MATKPPTRWCLVALCLSKLAADMIADCDWPLARWCYYVLLLRPLTRRIIIFMRIPSASSPSKGLCGRAQSCLNGLDPMAISRITRGNFQWVPSKKRGCFQPLIENIKENHNWKHVWNEPTLIITRSDMWPKGTSSTVWGPLQYQWICMAIQPSFQLPVVNICRLVWYTKKNQVHPPTVRKE